MSWLSKILGLDKNPSLLKEVNTVGAAVVSGVEDTSPIAKSLINVLESIGSEKTPTVATAVSDAGNIAAIFDPTFITTLETGLNNVVKSAVNLTISKLNLPLTAEEVDAVLVPELDKLFIEEFKAFNLIK